MSETKLIGAESCRLVTLGMFKRKLRNQSLITTRGTQLT